ncbi:beta-aspartyl-peptidase [uncultured Cloacibacillus sp.]|uniref:beta-aspartyl-peptidase n=1 Tax=uncultured Cloacibacillus sp. TaxID=889794 RepID=UPI0026DB3AFF|nr:beta-aspartyl-peptidase [uncultured Cloacibacillus sp.]
MFLIRGAEVYAPEPLGRKDVLIGFGKIIRIGEGLPGEYGGLDVDEVDAKDCILAPGFVDQHVHVMGAGGEAGFFSRTPEMQVSAIVSHGITTVVGLHGTDGTARNIEALYAKVCSLEQEGITARMLTGSFEMPSATLTGSVRRDLIFIDKVIGAKTAISDRRSSQPSRSDVEKLLAQAYTGGLVSGKRGYTHFHMGVGRRRLDMLADIIRETEIPPYLIIPTHVNRDEELFVQAMELAKMGAVIDITSGIAPEGGFGGAVKPSDAVVRCLENGVKIQNVTMSSDANGSMAVYDADGRFAGLCVTTVETMHKEFRDLARTKGVTLETALRPVTSSPAAAIGMYPRKGCVAEGSDADLIIMDKELSILKVFAMGRLAADEGGALLKGAFE